MQDDFSPWSTDLLATLGQVIPVIAAKAASTPNERLRRKTGSHNMHILQARSKTTQSWSCIFHSLSLTFTKCCENLNITIKS